MGMSDLEKKQRAAGRLRETNAGLMREIESLGGSLDVSVARIEHFIDGLVQIGVLTDEQRWDEQEKWERSLRGQLIPVRDKMREAFQARTAQMKKLQERQASAEAKQNPPETPKLIIPK